MLTGPFMVVLIILFVTITSDSWNAVWEEPGCQRINDAIYDTPRPNFEAQGVNIIFSALELRRC